MKLSLSLIIKKSLSLLIMGFCLSLSACNGWDESVNGNLLILNNNKFITLKGVDGTQTKLSPGFYNVEFDRGVFADWFRASRVTISYTDNTDGPSVTIRLPERIFTEDSVVLSPSETDQIYSVTVRKETRSKITESTSNAIYVSRRDHSITIGNGHYCHQRYHYDWTHITISLFDQKILIAEFEMDGPKSEDYSKYTNYCH